MSLQYHQTLVTPFEVAALHAVIATAREHRPEGDPDIETAYRWLAYARSGLFEQWRALPPGHHLKEAYRDAVWTWDDQDLAAIPEDRLVDPEAVRSIGEGFRRPTPEEIAEGVAREFPELADG
jgi:hypothetical protein